MVYLIKWSLSVYQSAVAFYTLFVLRYADRKLPWINIFNLLSINLTVYLLQIHTVLCQYYNSTPNVFSHSNLSGKAFCNLMWRYGYNFEKKVYILIMDTCLSTLNNRGKRSEIQLPSRKKKKNKNKTPVPSVLRFTLQVKLKVKCLMLLYFLCLL